MQHLSPPPPSTGLSSIVYIFKTHTHELSVPKGPGNIICTMMKYGEHTDTTKSIYVSMFCLFKVSILRIISDSNKLWHQGMLSAVPLCKKAPRKVSIMSVILARLMGQSERLNTSVRYVWNTFVKVVTPIIGG